MIVSWSVFGLIVGAIARFLVPGKQPMGILGTIVLGVVGFVLGGILGLLILAGEITISNPVGWIEGVLGAVIALLVYTRFMNGKTEKP